MGQKTTYSVPRETEADRIAKAERDKEKARIAEAELRETLTAAVVAEERRKTAEIVREQMEKRNGEPINAAKLTTETSANLAQMGVDEARLEELMNLHKKVPKTFFSGMKMALGAALKDMEYAMEAGRIASRLGKSNPIQAGVMGVSDGTGIIQDKVRFVEEILSTFTENYRKSGGQIGREYMELIRHKK